LIPSLSHYHFVLTPKAIHIYDRNEGHASRLVHNIEFSQCLNDENYGIDDLGNFEEGYCWSVKI